MKFQLKKSKHRNIARLRSGYNEENCFCKNNTLDSHNWYMTNGNNNLTIFELRSGSCLKEYETMKICFLTGIKEVNFKRNYGASSIGDIAR